jgi:hypothetical protein
MISGDEGGTPSTGWWPEVRQTKAEPDPGAEIGLSHHRAGGRTGLGPPVESGSAS